jgi:hypothetical protein
MSSPGDTSVNGVSKASTSLHFSVANHAHRGVRFRWSDEAIVAEVFSLCGGGQPIRRSRGVPGRLLHTTMGYGGPVTRSARLVTVFAVLAGIFLMHGLPAQSCAAGSGDMATMAVADHASHTEPAMSPGHGSPCVFTMPSRDHAPVLALVLLTVAALVTALWRPRLVGGPSRRGPPLSGPQLLTLVCVSRT